MDTQIDFITDINKYSKMSSKNITIGNDEFILNTKYYDDNRTCKTIKDWKTCLEMLGKHHLIKNKELMKVIYCLLTDCHIIQNVSDAPIDLDIYDPMLNKYFVLNIIDDKKRNIQLKIFTMCTTQIIIDYKNPMNYKIYELHNINSIKEHYGSKANMDTIINDMKLIPKFTGSINNLESDFKILTNQVTNKDFYILSIASSVRQQVRLEKQLRVEYKKYYKSICDDIRTQRVSKN
jgi:hypothetical protein